MPPSQTPYAKDERVLCFHHELLYEAKVLDSKPSDPTDKKSAPQYRVHYKGWKNTWDDWVPQDRVRKLTDENKELAQNLKKEMDALRQRTAPKATATFTKKKAAGSDLSSTRGSEERNSSVPATGRGQKRGRDYEIEKVGNHSSSVPPSSTLSATSSSSLDSLSSLSLREDSITSTPTSSMFLPPHPNPTLLALQNPNLRRGRSRAQLWPGGYEADGTVPRTSRTPKPLPPAEIILSKPFPKKKLHATLAKPSDYGAPHTTRKDMHPQISKLNFHDSGNEAKRQFFKGQDPRAVLMIAGFPKQEAMDSPPKRNGRMNANGAEHQVDIFQEESFHSRPAVRIVIPDHLKAILVDDWENVTKSLSLVPLPSAHPVNEILTTYFDEEKGKRRLGSAEADLLEEVVAGVREYFDKCLGRILLYRFEREQFFEIRQTWEGGVGEWEGKGPADVYGAEHLCRLFVSMPELIAQTNMDQQSVTRLREELAKLTQWLGKNSGRFFTSEYEAASQDYIEKARGL